MPAAVISLEDAMAQLASIAGADHAQLRGESIAVAPANAAEIAEILRFANENQLTVTPTGNGSKLEWGNPVSPNILLSVQRMAAVREHSWQDMTCTVEAGCTWDAMESVLARHRQTVALDPLWPASATVGGITATNDSGALRRKYGSLRDLILGMTVVLADGTIARTGGKVVKNVAGYDLHKLMTGSFGTLGVIADVNFRLHPLEEHRRTWTATAATSVQFAGPVRALLDAQIVPSAVQLRATRSSSALDVCLAMRPECEEEYADRLRNLLRDLTLEAASDTVWQARQEIFDGAAVVLKISTQPADLCAVVDDLQRWANSSGTDVDVVAQSSGLITVVLRNLPETAFLLIHSLRQRLLATGGSVVALRMPGEWRGRIDVWGGASDALSLMREIKRQFDPNSILNPGRFVGDI